MQIENNKLICGYADAYIKLWDLRTGKCHRNLYGHTVRSPLVLREEREVEE
jgi:WD40 repeat protein